MACHAVNPVVSLFISGDVRVWHGGCPNLCGEPRFLPCMEVQSRRYWRYAQLHKGRKDKPALPRALHAVLKESVKALTVHLITDGKQETSDKDSLLVCFTKVTWLAFRRKLLSSY